MRGIRGHDRDRLVRQALELARLPTYGERYPNQLSGGQQQRDRAGASAGFQPAVLLMDEPLGALDKNLRERCNSRSSAFRAKSVLPQST